MVGEVFHPKRIILRGKITRLVRLGENMAGSMDLQSPEQALTGMATQTLAADPPGAYLFQCHCGHIRRVIHTEANFRCERGGVGNDCTCDIIWFRKRRPTEEFDAEGQPVYVDDTVEETIEDVDQYSGEKVTRVMKVPQFYGRKVGEVKAEEMKRRREAGEPTQTYASPVVTERKVEVNKPKGGIFQEEKKK